MSDFATCYAWMMGNEDGPPPWCYKEVIDTGGQAISGINSAAFPDHFAAIAAIPQAERGPAVQAFYEAEFWNQWFEKLIDDELAKRVFDAAVNMGPGTAVKILQKAAQCPVDGKWGLITVNAANSAGEALVDSFRASRLEHYDAIVAANPSDSIYLGTEEHPGPWMRRALA